MKEMSKKIAVGVGSIAIIMGMAACSSKVATPVKSAVGETEAAPIVKAKPKFKSTEERYNHAMRLFESGDYFEAETQFMAVCERWPRFSKPHKHLARTQLKLGKYEEALENALDAAELNPKDGTIDNVIGLAYMELDDFDSAEAAFLMAIDKTPKFVWSYNNLGYLRIQRGDYEKARDVLAQGSTLANAPAVLFNSLGVAMEKTGDTAGAQVAYGKAMELDPQYEKAGMNVARVGTPAATEDLTVASVTESDTAVQAVVASDTPTPATAAR